MKPLLKNLSFALAGAYLGMLIILSIILISGCKKEIDTKHLIGASELTLFKLKDSTLWNNTTVEIDSQWHVLCICSADQRWKLNQGYILSRNVSFSNYFTLVPLNQAVEDINPFVIREDPFTSFYILPQMYGGQYSIELINWWIEIGEIEQHAKKIK